MADAPGTLDFLAVPCTVFRRTTRLASGPLGEVARLVKAEFDRDPTATCLTFDDRTGAQIDFDLSGSVDEFVARLDARAEYARYLAEMRREESGDTGESPSVSASAGRRPAVVAHEVTLLPRHWAWLARQPGTPSQVLRRLVDEARRRDAGRTEARAARDAAYAFVSAVAGDLPGYEEATRALFAGDCERFDLHTARWPTDVREYAVRLAAPAFAGG